MRLSDTSGHFADDAIVEAAEDLVPDSDAMARYVVEHIDEAVSNRWIRVYYQPVIRTLTGKLCGLEALARWDDPVHGLLLPFEFIEPLEKANLIHKLDSYVIRHVCRHYRECTDGGYPIVPISFNLSRLDFELCDIFSVIEQAVHHYEVPRNMLNIEITESVLGSDPEYMAKMVQRFRDMGYQIWMDDFGSGYSSLNVLKDFECDELKIDMAFLSRFDERSKTILASVVDMAKRLGIQTLAEGVENEEHCAYLRQIGCEKMQGYLFGKPQPYSVERALEAAQTMGIEYPAETHYLSEIGSVNTLSLSERDFSAAALSKSYVTNMALALVEFDGSSFRAINSNHVFQEGLANMGIPSVEVAEEMVNDPDNYVSRSLKRLMRTIEVEKFARLDFMRGERSCVMRIRYIASHAGTMALIISLDDTAGMKEQRRKVNIDESLKVLYSVYEHVDIIHLDEDTAEQVFSHAGFRPVYDSPALDVAVRRFADAEVFPPDRKRYLEFMDMSTIVQRIRESGENYLTGFFRTHAQGGDYVWKLFMLIRMPNTDANDLLICVRDTHWAHDGLFQQAYDGHGDDGRRDVSQVDLRITDGSLWRSIIRDESMGLFWKDRNRRFVGANQTFLDYYGFDSLDDILGKTDEDMGWHVDPVPYMEEELRVLNEGHVMEDVPGRCIVRGAIHDIIASKRPIYRNGQIVGLVGRFIDASAKLQLDKNLNHVALVDPVTDTLNYTGYEIDLANYVDSYKKLGTNFGMINVDIDSFKSINDEYGYVFGDKVLRRVADELRAVAGQKCSISHVYADRFIVLAQCTTANDLVQLCKAIQERLAAIARIDGMPCTIYAFSSYARYSEVEDADALKDLCLLRLQEAKEHVRG